MASSVDVTFPADGEKVSKSEMRAQWQVIKDEIEALQKKISVAGFAAFHDQPDRSEIETMIRVIQSRGERLPYQTATGVVDL